MRVCKKGKFLRELMNEVDVEATPIAGGMGRRHCPAFHRVGSPLPQETGSFLLKKGMKSKSDIQKW
jgi:hypothetical protein